MKPTTALTYGAFVYAEYTGKDKQKRARTDSIINTLKTDMFKSDFDQGCAQRTREKGQCLDGVASVSKTGNGITLELPRKMTDSQWEKLQGAFKTKHFQVKRWDLSTAMLPKPALALPENKKQLMLVG
jgi:hypothetical protein